MLSIGWNSAKHRESQIQQRLPKLECIGMSDSNMRNFGERLIDVLKSVLLLFSNCNHGPETGSGTCVLALRRFRRGFHSWSGRSELGGCADEGLFACAAEDAALYIWGGMQEEKLRLRPSCKFSIVFGCRALEERLTFDAFSRKSMWSMRT